MGVKDRALDNAFVERLWRTAKQKEVYLKGYWNIPECRGRLSACFAQYNKLREHQSLDYHYTPEVYFGDIVLKKAAWWIESTTYLTHYLTQKNCLVSPTALEAVSFPDPPKFSLYSPWHKGKHGSCFRFRNLKNLRPPQTRILLSVIPRSGGSVSIRSDPMISFCIRIHPKF